MPMLDRSNGHRHARLTFRPGTDAPVSLQALNWRRLFACLKPYRGRMALATLALLISTGLGIAFPMVIVRLLDTVTHAKSAGALNGRSEERRVGKEGRCWGSASKSQERQKK